MATGHPEPSPSPARLRIFCGAVFLLLLGTHLWLASRNLTAGFLPRHEFRQTQTALSILFILRDYNFSLAYPTPLFGPPWSVPMEFPLYQWTVAGLVKLTAWPLPVAARVVGLTCFYLSLPGLLLLARELRLERTARWMWLCLTLAAPLYIFYSRSILIESMALMFSTWFLACFTAMCRRHSLRWWPAVAVTGTAAALVKVTTFVPWGVGAALVGLAWAWPAWRTRHRARLGVVIRGGLLAAAGPCLATFWWVRTADAIKAQSPGGAELTSAELTAVNLGTTADRLNLGAWRGVLRYLDEGLLPWWALPLLLALAWGTLREQRRRLLLLLAMVGSAPALFPLLYQRHDYYLYAIGTPLLAATAVLAARIARRWPHPLVPTGLLLGLVALQLLSYHRGFARTQAIVSHGGSGLTNVIRDLLPQDAILVIAGQDWTSAFPYYSQRRAVMLREEVARNPAARADFFDPLVGEPVAGLLLTAHQRDNASLVRDLHRRFGIVPEIAVSHGATDAYFTPQDRYAIIDGVRKHPHFPGVVIRGTLPPPPDPEPWLNDGQVHSVQPIQADQIFKFVTPRPFQYRSRFGFGVVNLPDGEGLGAHPDSAFWLRADPSHRHLDYGFGIQPAALTGDSPSDGVRFEISVQDETGRELLRRTHDFRPNTAHGEAAGQSHRLDLPPGTAVLVLSTGALNNYAHDWAYWSHVTLN